MNEKYHHNEARKLQFFLTLKHIDDERTVPTFNHLTISDRAQLPRSSNAE